MRASPTDMRTTTSAAIPVGFSSSPDSRRGRWICSPSVPFAVSISNEVTVYRPLRAGGAHPARLDGRRFGGSGAALTTPRTGVDPSIGFCRLSA